MPRHFSNKDIPRRTLRRIACISSRGQYQCTARSCSRTTLSRPHITMHHFPTIPSFSRFELSSRCKVQEKRDYQRGFCHQRGPAISNKSNGPAPSPNFLGVSRIPSSMQFDGRQRRRRDEPQRPCALPMWREPIRMMWRPFPVGVAICT